MFDLGTKKCPVSDDPHRIFLKSIYWWFLTPWNPNIRSKFSISFMQCTVCLVLDYSFSACVCPPPWRKDGSGGDIKFIMKFNFLAMSIRNTVRSFSSIVPIQFQNAQSIFRYGRCCISKMSRVIKFGKVYLVVPWARGREKRDSKGAFNSEGSLFKGPENWHFWKV